MIYPPIEAFGRLTAARPLSVAVDIVLWLIGQSAQQGLQRGCQAVKVVDLLPVDISVAKVLIIDDDHAFSAVLSETLESFRHEVQEAENSVKAFELLHTVNFDLIFLDLTLPDVSGLEVLRGIRADKKIRHLPVIILTAQANYRPR